MMIRKYSQKLSISLTFDMIINGHGRLRMESGGCIGGNQRDAHSHVIFMLVIHSGTVVKLQRDSVNSCFVTVNSFCPPLLFVVALQGVIHVSFSKVNELPLSSDDPGRYLFEIVPRKN